MNSILTIQKPDLIIFGGAFDPPHQGHFECLQIVKEHFPKADIYIIPSLLTPATSLQNKTTTAQFEDRLEMCRLAFSKAPQGVEVLDIEKSLPSPSYTIQTLRKLKEKFPKKHLGFLIGLDQLQKFHLWFEPLEILEIASPIVVPRETKSVELSIRMCAKNLGIAIHKITDTYVEWSVKYPLFFMNKTPIAISSTSLRQKIQKDFFVSPSFIDSNVLHYIQNKSLYK